jgi:DNA invertase Pin-like site-specific DNA recombinase
MAMSRRQLTLEEIRGLRLKAAIYIRMSTDLQTESPENQERQIRAYAERYNIEVVRVYKDLGISGMTAEDRPQFRALIDEVQHSRVEFNIVLYLDESRWGRFPDSRDADYYRMILAHRNVICQSCDQELTLDKSGIVERILTMLKDESASEYSRQLSQKVFVGQCHLIGKGFRQGGPAGFGLRRMLLDEAGNPKQELSIGQRKSLQTERVILVPGPPEETGMVKWIYDQHIAGRREREIADLMNARGWKTDFGRPWSVGTVREVLTNEKYLGHNIYNRRSSKLKSKSKPNPIEEWVIKENAFAQIVDQERYDFAQAIFRERNKKFSNDELLDRLRNLLSLKGMLSALIIDETEEMPPSSLYAHRFGGLLRAYKLVGYIPERDYGYVEINRALRLVHKDIADKIITTIERLGDRRIPFNTETGLLAINYNLHASLVISRCSVLPSGGLRWKIRLDSALRPDLTIAVRMEPNNKEIHDYYLLPSIEFGHNNLKLSEDNIGLLDSFRFDTLEFLWKIGINVSIDKAA